MNASMISITMLLDTHGHANVNISFYNMHITSFICLFLFLPHCCICQVKSGPVRAAKLPDMDDDPSPPSLAPPQEPPPSQEGYDVEIVNDTGAYDCLICHLIPRDPMQVSCCRKWFCRTCITRVLSDKNICPHCRARGDTFEVFEDKGQRHAIQELKVYCPTKQQGCSWIGELYNLDTHLNSKPKEGSESKGCQYTVLTCDCCTEHYPRHLRRQHIRSCQLQPYTCPYCKHRIICYRNLTGHHVSECEMFLVSCPSCDVKVPRMDLHLHKTECLQRKLSQGTG